MTIYLRGPSPFSVINQTYIQYTLFLPPWKGILQCFQTQNVQVFYLYRYALCKDKRIWLTGTVNAINTSDQTRSYLSLHNTSLLRELRCCFIALIKSNVLIKWTWYESSKFCQILHCALINIASYNENHELTPFTKLH